MTKIIQSLWTSPWRGVSATNVRCGWSTPFHHWAGWLYSSLLAKQSYGNVHLITDTLGARTADAFQLPYDSVTVQLDNLPVNPNLPNAGKYTAYLQPEPFVHIDADTFLLHRLPDECHQAPVLVQHRDGKGGLFWENYAEGSAIVASMEHRDDGWDQYASHDAAYNLGIFGGTDLEAIAAYSQTVQRFIQQNHQRLSQHSEIALASVARVIENKLAYCFFTQRGTNVVPIIRPDEWEQRDALATSRGFCHLMGKKKDPSSSRRLIARLENEFPQQLENLYRVFGTSHAPTRPPRIYAVVTIYDSPDILPHFLDHYTRLGVDRILVVSTIDLPRQPEYERLYPVTFFPSDTKHFGNDDKSRGELLALQSVQALPNDWVLHLDLDEFQQYPTDLRSLTRLMASSGIDAIEGTLLDRVSSDGVLTPINPTPLDDQYPLQCRLTRYNNGTLQKIMVARYRVSVGSGRHKTTDGTDSQRYPVGCAADYRVHHFRWAAGLVERLESRFRSMVEHYPDRKYPAANLEFCARYRRTGAIDLTDPQLAVSPAPRLSYPTTSPAVEFLMTMPPNLYAIDDGDSAALNDFVRGRGVKRVLEFGPGRSTLVWAALGYDVDALEYDPAELGRLTKLFAPLSSVRLFGHDRPIAVDLPYERYDLAFVDGPAGSHYAERTRLDAVLFAAARCDTVLLHDANREGERQTLAHMRGLGYRVHALPSVRGIAVITRS